MRGRRDPKGLTRALKIENSKWPIFPADRTETKSRPAFIMTCIAAVRAAVICAVSLQNALGIGDAGGTRVFACVPSRIERRVNARESISPRGDIDVGVFSSGQKNERDLARFAVSFDESPQPDLSSVRVSYILCAYGYREKKFNFTMKRRVDTSCINITSA